VASLPPEIRTKLSGVAKKMGKFKFLTPGILIILMIQWATGKYVDKWTGKMKNILKN